MKLVEIAERIHGHLKQFENDRRVNRIKPSTGMSPYFWVSCFATGTRIKVVYVSFQGASVLSKSVALEYLEWLDAGNVGTHYDMQRTKSAYSEKDK